MHNDDDTDARLPVAETVQAMMLAGDADWLADAVEHAMETGDALYLLAQCRRHIEPARQAEAQKALGSLRRDGDEPDPDSAAGRRWTRAGGLQA